MPAPIPGSLGDGCRVHVVRDAQATYRDAACPSVPIDAAGETLAPLVYTSQPVSRDLEPEVWWAPDRDHGLVVTMRVLRWRAHAIVLSVAVVPDTAPRLCDAAIALDLVRAIADERGWSLDRARAELHVAQWCASAVDIGGDPERWRYRSRLTDDDVSLVVRRAGGPTPIVIAAEWRGYAGAGRPAQRQRRRR